MKIILTIFCILLPLKSIGQKSKSTKIWEITRNREILHATYFIDEDNKVDEIKIYFVAQNSKYSSLVDLISIFFGTPQEFYEFLNEIEYFYETNEPQTTVKIFDQTISLNKILGKTSLFVYDIENEDYHLFSIKSLRIFKEKFELWAKDNDVPITALR